MKQTKTRNLYVDPRHNGKPAHSLKGVLATAFCAAEEDVLKLSGIGTRPGKGRTKLVVTVTVEEVPA